MFPNSMRSPIGSCPGQRVLASDSLITAACGAPEASRPSNGRPRTSGIPMARKYCSLASRNSASPTCAASPNSRPSESNASGPHRREPRATARHGVVNQPLGGRCQDDEPAVPCVPAAHRERAHSPCGRHARQPLHAREHVVMDTRESLRPRGVVGRGARQLQRHQVLGAEPRVFGEQAAHAARQQAGSHEQHERRRDLRNHQRGAQAHSGAAGADAAAPSFNPSSGCRPVARQPARSPIATALPVAIPIANASAGQLT